MTKKLYSICSGIPAAAVSGVFLFAGLALMLLKTEMPIDPSLAAAVICGYPLFYTAADRLISGKGMEKISSSLLISIAMIASAAIGELFAAGEIAFIMAIGEILEEKTVERARKGIKRLIGLVPDTGRVMRDGVEELIPVSRIKKGDVLRVLPGEAVPVDGVILSGSTSVDQSVITGESLPADKSAGDGVYCGTINQFGSVDITATDVGEDSSLKKLIRLVEQAEESKAPMQRVADRWASWLVPLALLVAAAAFLITKDAVRAVTVLVVFCPCALALATPTSITAAIGQAAKHGVIIKSGEALENMGRVDVVAFDKTGTLTEGKLGVSDVEVFSSRMNKDELLSAAASAEAHSEHPLGKAISAYAKKRGAAILPATDFKMIPGKGISAKINGKDIFCGNRAYLLENGVSFSERADEALERLSGEGKATVLAASGSVCIGVIALSDSLREYAGNMAADLGALRADAVLLTGDNRRAAEYFSKRAGITRVYSELLPDGKTERIRALQNEGRVVCMIGDGVNDAPALKTANVGVAMGNAGSDIAVDAADIALVGDDLSKISYLKRLSNATVRLITFNISLSMLINFAAIILSVLSLLGPVIGALVHNAGSVLVVLNAALHYDRKYI